MGMYHAIYCNTPVILGSNFTLTGIIQTSDLLDIIRNRKGYCTVCLRIGVGGELIGLINGKVPRSK